MQNGEKTADALRAARMYFYQNLTTAAIARELNISRSTVSRLIRYARQKGIVDIRIIDPREQPRLLESAILRSYHIKKAHIVPVADFLGEEEWLQRTAQFAAKYLNTVFESNMILGIAWGTTLSAISRYLLPKTLHNCQIVQLNGAGNTQSMGVEYASEIILRFVANYGASAHLFPVPTIFNYAETKTALWRERSIQRILNLHAKTDLLLYSIGAVNAGVPSHVYAGGYLEQKDYKELERDDVAGDIATVFFRSDGSFNNIAINARASGPNLSLFREKHGICVVSGLAKVRGLHAALKGGLIKELIVDEPSARALVENYIKT